MVQVLVLSTFTQGTRKSVGCQSLIGIIPRSLLELLPALLGIYHGVLTSRLKVSPNLPSYVLYEGLIPKFLLRQEECVKGIKQPTIELLVLGLVYVLAVIIPQGWRSIMLLVSNNPQLSYWFLELYMHSLQSFHGLEINTMLLAYSNINMGTPLSMLLNHSIYLFIYICLSSPVSWIEKLFSCLYR